MQFSSLIIKNKPIERQEQKVDYRFKIIYTIGIISVISSHLAGKSSLELSIQNWFPYRSFHMPLFMFSAGYFFKNKNVLHVRKYVYLKFKKLILPIYLYNFFYGILISLLKEYEFAIKIRPFTLRNIFIAPLGTSKILFISPSWFSATLFFVEIYNIFKRKASKLIKIEFNEFIYFIIDAFISYSSVNLSNKGYNRNNLNKYILRFMHLNIYYQIGIIYNKLLESYVKKIKGDIIFICIFSTKLIFNIYYSKMPVFQYSRSEYYNYPHFTVIIISVSGILFYLRISELLEPSIGKNFYINIIANNTFSIMMNHFFAIFMIRTFFSFISIRTKYCKDFNFKMHYSTLYYIYIPNNIDSIGIFYFLSCFVFPIGLQKIIDMIKKKTQFLLLNYYNN